MQFHDNQYLNLMNQVLTFGERRPNRTGVDAISQFDGHMVFDLSDGTIPLLTTKKMHTKSIIRELLWFLSGDTNIKYLNEHGVRIWDEWADENGNLGPVYGQMWRAYPGVDGSAPVDQISELISKLKNNPTDRRMIVNGWHPALLPVDGVAPKDQVALGRQALPPCHMTWQCYVNIEEQSLSLKLVQRSADIFLGVPFNIAQYGILLHMLAHVTGLKPGRLIWTGGDVHVYDNLVVQCYQQLKRSAFPSPTLSFTRDIGSIFDFEYEDFVISGYESHGTISGKVAV